MDDHQQLHKLKKWLSDRKAAIEAATLDEDLKKLARDALLAWVGGKSSKEWIEDIEVTKAEREWLEDADLCGRGRRNSRLMGQSGGRRSE